MSTTSRSYRPSRYSWQIAPRLFTAQTDRGVKPVTYRRSTYRSGTTASSSSRTEIQSHEHTLRVRQIADDLLDGLRQPPHERRQCEDLVALGELGVLEEIDHLDLVAPLQVRFADLLQIREREDRLRGLSRDVEAQHVRLGTVRRGQRRRSVLRQLHGDGLRCASLSRPESSCRLRSAETR